MAYGYAHRDFFYYIKWKVDGKFVPAYIDYHDTIAKLHVSTSLEGAKELLRDVKEQHPDKEFKIFEASGYSEVQL